MEKESILTLSISLDECFPMCISLNVDLLFQFYVINLIASLVVCSLYLSFFAF